MGSYLELGFWFEHGSDNDSLSSIIGVLRTVGATVLPEAQLLGDDVGTEFRSITDGSRAVVDLHRQPHGIDEVLTGDSRVASVAIDGVLNEAGQPVTLRLSYTAEPSARHPVVILIEDTIAWHPPPASPVVAGLEVRAVFEELCRRLDPAYAAMFAEFALPEPSAVTGTGHMFRDAYFSRSFLNPGDIAELEESLGLAPSTESGLWVFSTSAFGEVNCSLPDGYGRQVERAIARASNSRW